MLTQERLKEILHYNPDTGSMNWLVLDRNKNPDKEAGCLSKDGYKVIQIDGRQYKAHRIAWLYFYGTWPKKQIDHINRIKNDNRIHNLREANTSENAQNIVKTKNNTGYRGVTYWSNSGKYVAMICINGKNKFLGSFTTPEDAHAAYIEEKKKYHKFFNFTI